MSADSHHYINKYDYEKLLDDIKLISKSIRIVRDENNPENRKYACSLVEDLVTRLFKDIYEMHEAGGETVISLEDLEGGRHD